VRFLVSLVTLMALTGCAASTAAGPSPGSPSTSTTGSLPANDLLVEIHRDGSTPTESYRLTCGSSASGNHPAGPAACAHLLALAHPFAPIRADQMCSQIYGGPQTAHITGRWKGAAVDLRVSRVDGCRVEQWNSLGPLLPGPVGVSPPS
jgi:hypothetical protein